MGMRTPLPLLPALVLALCLSACGSDGPTPLVEDPAASAAAEEPSPSGPLPQEPGPPDPPDEEPSPQSTADFGEAVGFAHPVGPHGADPGEEADVVYTVDGVERPWAGRVDFTVSVEVPELARTFPLTDMEVVCEAGPEIPLAQTEEPLAAVEQGTHDSRMWCEIPDDADRVRIVVTNGDDEAAFGGSV